MKLADKCAVRFAKTMAGEYTLRCRTIDEKGIAQPMPQPFQKSGNSAIESVEITIKS